MTNTTLQLIKDAKPVPGRNSMGCSESWYNPYYMVSQCFTIEELESMKPEEIDNLIKLADFASDVFY